MLLPNESGQSGEEGGLGGGGGDAWPHLYIVLASHCVLMSWMEPDRISFPMIISATRDLSGVAAVAAVAPCRSLEDPLTDGSMLRQQKPGGGGGGARGGRCEVILPALEAGRPWGCVAGV